jgi:hypothetical protein
MPAALDGAEGRLQGVGCRVLAGHLYLHAHAVSDLKPMAQAACDDLNKKMIDTGRVYPPGFAVYITLGLKFNFP